MLYTFNSLVPNGVLASIWSTCISSGGRCMYGQFVPNIGMQPSLTNCCFPGAPSYGGMRTWVEGSQERLEPPTYSPLTPCLVAARSYCILTGGHCMCGQFVPNIGMQPSLTNCCFPGAPSYGSMRTWVEGSQERLEPPTYSPLTPCLVAARSYCILT